MDNPGRVRSHIISVVFQIQQFDFDYSLLEYSVPKLVSLAYRRLRFVVWNRSHSKDMNRSAVVVMPKNVQLVEFYNLINIDIPIRQVIKLMFFKLKKYRFKRQHEINRKPVP